MSMDQDARERFGWFVTSMNSASSQYELYEARKAAEAIAREHGMTFEAALREHRSPTAVADDDSFEDDEAEDEDEPTLAPGSEPAVQSCSSVNVADAESGPEPGEPSLSTTGEIERVAAVKAALAANPNRSDRDVAREIGCSPTTVGRARAAAGLVRLVRKVTRGGSSYDMAAGREPDDAS